MLSLEDDDAARQALRTAVDRAAHLIAGIDDLDRPAPGLTWTVGETATHMVIAVRNYRECIAGEVPSATPFIPDVTDYTVRMAGMTSGTLTAEPPRDAATISATLREDADAFVRASDARQPYAPVSLPWIGVNASLPVRLAVRLLLGEVLIHGLDIARGLRRPWRITTGEALLVLPAAIAVMPRLFDPARARGMRALFRIRMRGGPTIGVRIDDGTIEVAPWNEDHTRPDCTLVAEPVAFMLLGFGRMGQWPLIAQGRLLAYGRKPWLGLRLRSLFVNP